MKLFVTLFLAAVAGAEIAGAIWLLSSTPLLTQGELEARDAAMMRKGYDCALDRMSINRCSLK